MKRLMVLCIVGLACVACCGGKSKAEEQTKVDAVEVLYFHGTQRCASCVAVEKETKALLGAQYGELMEQGRVCFRAIDLIEEEALADEYEVVWSSLLLVDYDAQGTKSVTDLTDFAFLNAKTAPERFREELSKHIDRMVNN